MRVGKRGVSAVVASVLLIGMVVSLASVVFVWSKGFVDEKTSSTGSAVVSKLCQDVNFDVALVGSSSGVYEFEVVNRGDVDIDSLEFEVWYGKSSEIIDSGVGVVGGGSFVGQVNLGNGFDGVYVVAVFESDSEDVFCMDQKLKFGI